MIIDQRRSKRYNDFIAVSVRAVNDQDGSSEIGPFAGRIINISIHGACLLMALGVLESFDVYRSTYKNDEMHLEIDGTLPLQTDNFALSGKPIWMDPFILDDIKAFKMGVEFKNIADHEQSIEIIHIITAEPDRDDLFEIIEG